MATHLTKRGGVYYMRRRIPQDLVTTFGKHEIVQSLRTKDRAEAERLLRRASVDLDEQFLRERVSFIREGRDEKPVYGPAEREDVPHTLIQSAVVIPAIQGSRRNERILMRRAKITLDSLIPSWQRDRAPTAKTVSEVERVVRDAGDLDVTSITRQAIIEVRDRWLICGSSAATVNKKVGFLRLLLGVAKDRGMIDVNPAEGAELPVSKRAVELRQPYSQDQIDAVMAATDGCQSSDPLMHWLPRLGRWTGARLNELHQLRTCDVQLRDGVLGVFITDEGEHALGIPMRLKNPASRRWIPLASSLSEFVGWVSNRPTGPIFPANPDVHGIVSAAFSKRYGRFLRDRAQIADRRITFHSWRHNFADMCRAAGVAPDVRMALMGHAEGGVSGIYGAGDAFAVNRLVEAVTAIDAAYAQKKTLE